MKTVPVSCFLALVLLPAAVFAAPAKKDPAKEAAARFAAACREANADVQKAVKEARAERAAAPRPFVFGLKEGGSTYGLYDSRFKVKADPPVDLTAAYAKIRAALPEKLSPADEIELAKAELVLELRGGSYEGRARALAKLTAHPTDEKAVRGAVGGFKDMRAWAELLAFAERVLAANRGKNGNLYASALGWRWLAACQLNDGDLADETRKLVETLPLTVDNMRATYIEVMAACKDQSVFRDLLAKLDKASEKPFREMILRSQFSGACQACDCARIRELLPEMEKSGDVKRAFGPAADAFLASRCWGEAVTYAEKALALEADSPVAHTRLVRALLGAGRRAEAAERALALAALPKAKPSERFAGRVLAQFAQAETPTDLTRRLVALAMADDSGAKDQAEAASWLMTASSKAFFPLMTSDSSQWMLAARQAYFDLTHEEQRVVHTVRYYPSAPRTAMGAEAAGLFDPGWLSDYAVENRFGAMWTYTWENRDGILKNLKCKPKANLVAVKGEGRSAELIAVYDDTGVHIYSRFRDPAAEKFKYGEVAGAGYELSVFPGEGGWNQVFTRTDAVKDLNELAWDGIDYGHRPTTGSIVTDSTTTDTAFLFHTFIPWTHVYNRLPENGTTWLSVVCASMPAGTFVIGGGTVHEFGRGLRLVFEMDDGQRDLVRKALVRRAAGDFLRFKSAWKNIDMWGDDILGDPAFFAASVTPWCERVGRAAAKVVACKPGEMDGAELATAEGFLCDWLDPQLRLNDLRVAWLQKGFFAEGMK